MLGVLLAKDLRRARRNPVADLLHLAIPLVITALLGGPFFLWLLVRGAPERGRLGSLGE